MDIEPTIKVDSIANNLGYAHLSVVYRSIMLAPFVVSTDIYPEHTGWYDLMAQISSVITKRKSRDPEYKFSINVMDRNIEIECLRARVNEIIDTQYEEIGIACGIHVKCENDELVIAEYPKFNLDSYRKGNVNRKRIFWRDWADWNLVIASQNETVANRLVLLLKMSEQLGIT